MPEEMELKVKVIGIPADVPPDTVSSELNHVGYITNIVTPLFFLGKCVARNAFLVKLRKVDNFQARIHVSPAHQSAGLQD